MSTLGKDLARGLGRSLLVQLIALILGLPLGCLLVGVNLWAANTFYDRPWILVGFVIASLSLVFGGSLLTVLISVLRRKAQLDAVFVPLGLEGDVYQTFFRQYHGELGERKVGAYFYRGPILEVEVATSLQARLSVTLQAHKDTRFLAGVANQIPLVLDDPALADLLVFAPDEAWARDVLSRPEILGALHRLTALTGMFSRQQVILSPGTVKLMCSGSRRVFGIDLAADQVGTWMQDLLTVVRVAESRPAPQAVAELTSLERLALKSRQRTKYLALWAGLGTLLFFVVLSVVVAVAIFALSRAGAL